MDTIIQLIRNGLCCIKDLNLFPSSFLHSPALTSKYVFEFPPPLDETTPLEILIAITQFYAFFSLSTSGLRLIVSSLRKRSLVGRLSRCYEPSGENQTAAKLIRESMEETKADAAKGVVTGCCVLGIGGSFFWLTANSLHVTATNWIGGLPALIHALTVAEIGLLILLYYMWKDASGKMRSSASAKRLAKELDGCEGRLGDVFARNVSAVKYGWITGGWTPFWIKSENFSVADDVELRKRLADSEKKVQLSIVGLSQGDTKKNLKDDDKDKDAVVRERTLELSRIARSSQKDGYMEYVYFVLNFVAFYGYMLSVISYYYDKDDYQPGHIYYLKLGMRSQEADWRGNFAGDMMWTIEPFLILCSPFFLKDAVIKSKSD